MESRAGARSVASRPRLGTLPDEWSAALYWVNHLPVYHLPMKKRIFCSLIMALAASATVLAQGMLRVFPEQAELAVLTPRLHPEILLDGKPDRLSPGALIRDLNNRIVILNSLPDQDVIVSFIREPATKQIQFVWILSQAEFDREKERMKQKRRAEKAAAGG
jgi:hypothetical protein